MTGRRVLAAVLVAAATAGCGTASDHAEREALAALGVQASPPSPSSTSAKGPRCNVDASLRPPAAMPAPGAMPAGSDMAAIRRRGHLLVGVDQNTRLLAYWNPLTKRFTGFEIDIAHELARAIFGNPNAVEFRALTTDERIPAVQSGEVDLSIDAITITCARKQQVDFSTVYFLARQRLLVRRDSPLSSARDLAGHRVCATEGSTSLETIEHVAAARDPRRRSTADRLPRRTRRGLGAGGHQRRRDPARLQVAGSAYQDRWSLAGSGAIRDRDQQASPGSCPVRQRRPRTVAARRGLAAPVREVVRAADAHQPISTNRVL